MRISTKRTLLRAATAATIVSAAAVIFLPAQASMTVTSSPAWSVCDQSLATGCAPASEISQLRVR